MTATAVILSLSAIGLFILTLKRVSNVKDENHYVQFLEQAWLYRYFADSQTTGISWLWKLSLRYEIEFNDLESIK